MKHVVGVDIGGTTIKAGLVDQYGTIKGYCEDDTAGAKASADKIVTNIKQNILKLIANYPDCNIRRPLEWEFLALSRTQKEC